jgi:ATP-binding cassette, subfamily F, member 3
MANRPLLQIKDLSKSFGVKKIFTEANLVVSENQKIGVIGRNGAGKTTLFKMIMGLDEPDLGEIQHYPYMRLGYIEQNDPFLEGETVIEFLERYTKKPSWECAKVASRFQLKNEKLEMKVTSLSGGFQMRVKLTATLLFEPNLLLLDEPTNYLDLSTLILLEKFLLDFKGTVMVITHDREFIKKTCTSTLDVGNGQLFLHNEGLEEYLEFKQEQEELAKSVNENIEKKQKQLQTFVDKFGAKASKAKSAQSKMRLIDKLDTKKIGIATAFSTVKMHIPAVENKQGDAMECLQMDIGYPNKTIVKNIDLRVERGKKTAILGDNGQGKSTFMKTIMGEIPAVKGQVVWKKGLKLGFYNQHVSEGLKPEDTIFAFASRAAEGNASMDEVYRILGNFLFTRNDYDKTVSVLSGGEKARLCLAGIFLGKADVYLLDEPTNHLDFETVEALGAALGAFNGTVFVISHNRTFVSLIANEIIEIKDGGLKRILGSYQDYVWNLEQAADLESSSNKKSELDVQSKFDVSGGNGNNAGAASSVSGGSTASSGGNLSKEARKKLFELNKELQKAERKMQNLENLIDEGQNDDITKAKLADAEIVWLELKDKIEKV